MPETKSTTEPTLEPEQNDTNAAEDEAEETETDEEDESQDSDDEDDEAGEDDESPADASVEPASRAALPAPRKRTSMAKEDQLGPRPPMATHWRCRRVEDDGKKTTLLYHDDGDGIAVCEWTIRTCAPEVIRQRWGARGGAFVVQFIHSDEMGQRRPCGRSRMLLLTPPDDRTPRSAPLPGAAPTPPAPAFSPMLGAAPASPQPGSFSEMLSLLGHLQDRDDKSRAAAREDSRLAIERYRADTDLMMERERNATKERIAQIDANARMAGRVAAGAAGIDSDALAQKIGEVVGARVEEALADDDEDNETPAPPPPAPAASATQEKLMENIMTLANMFGPILMQKFSDASAAAAAAPVAAAVNAAGT